MRNHNIESNKDMWVRVTSHQTIPKQEPRPRIAVVVLNYFKSERVVEGLLALRKQSAYNDCAVVVVDNSKSDAEARVLNDTLMNNEKLIVTHENLGYSQGINLGVSNVWGWDYLLLMNPDILVPDKDTISEMCRVLEKNPKLGILSSMQRNDDGSVVEVARRFPSLPIQVLRRLFPTQFHEHDLLEPLQGANAELLVNMDWVQSSFIMIRRSLWDRIGGFDERFFVFMADVEMCRMAWKEGYEVAVTSAVTVRADGVRASQGAFRDIIHEKVLRIHIMDALKYQMNVTYQTLKPLLKSRNQNLK